MDQIQKNDATASWDGFSYQGKITVLFALQLINKFTYGELEQFSIEVEGLEDFALKQNEDNGNGTIEKRYVSLHQVKHKLSSSTLNAYLDAMYLMFLKKRDNCATILHISRGITDWSYEKYEERIESRLSKLEEDVDKVKNKLIIENEKDIISEDNIAKLNLDMEGIQEKKSNYSKMKNIEEFSNFELYRYTIDGRDSPHCDGEQISELINHEIKDYFTKNGLHKYTGTNSLDIVRLNLIGFIDEHVGKRHRKVECDRDIKLDVIEEFLKSPKILEQSSQYYLYKILDWYKYEEMNDFCDNYCNLRNDCNLDSHLLDCELNKFIFGFSAEKDDEFEKFIKKVNPHISEIYTEKGEREHFQSEPTFLYKLLFNEFEKQFLVTENKMVLRRDDGYYTPTTIEVVERKKISETIKISKAIRQNESLLDLLYETNHLITSNIESPNIFDKDYDDEDVSYKERKKTVEKEKGFMNLSLSLKTFKSIGGENEDNS